MWFAVGSDHCGHDKKKGVRQNWTLGSRPFNPLKKGKKKRKLMSTFRPIIWLKMTHYLWYEGIG